MVLLYFTTISGTDSISSIRRTTTIWSTLPRDAKLLAYEGALIEVGQATLVCNCTLTMSRDMSVQEAPAITDSRVYSERVQGPQECDARWCPSAFRHKYKRADR